MSFFLALDRTFSTLLNWSDEGGHLCFVVNLEDKPSVFTSLNTILAVVFHVWLFWLGSFPSIYVLLSIFIMKKCWILSNYFSALIEMMVRFLLSILLMWYGIHWFSYINPSLHLDINSTLKTYANKFYGVWSWYISVVPGK